MTDEGTALLDEVLTAYLRAVDEGSAPDRAELLARHPELAPDIERFLAAQDAFARWAEPVRQFHQALPAEEGDAFGIGSFADYELLGLIARGGMGAVFKARQRSVPRLVALKVIRAGPAATADDVRRFRNEVETVARLDHPNVVPVYDAGEQDGALYFSMKLYEAGSLADRLDGFAADPRETVRLVAELARAVHHAHQRGVLHRDLKPSNVLLDEAGRPAVADFGLARRLDADGDQSRSGAVVGTPAYMAPELVDGHKGVATVAADVYGVGAVLYALLTGRPPFRGATVLETLEQVKGREPEPPRRLNPRVDRDLETVCLKCLHKDPSERYGSAQAMADDLERWLKGEAITARRLSLVQRVGRWIQRHPRWAAAFAGVSLLVTVAWVAWDRQRSQAEGAASQVAAQAEELWRKGRIREAEAVARRAADLLPRFGGDAQLKQSVEERVADYTLLRRLDDAWLKGVNHQGNATAIDPRPMLDGLEAAFREEYGVDVLGGDEAVVLADLERRAIRTELITALDSWSGETEDPTEVRRLLKLADALDPEPRGIAARWRRANGPGKLDDLRELAAEAERNPPPTAFLVRLGLSLIESSDRAAGLRVLRLAHRQRPDDLGVIVELAKQLHLDGDEHAAEVLPYWTAALSLRPGSPVLLNNLGYTLNRVGRNAEALDYLRMAEAIEPNTSVIHRNIGVALVNLGQLEKAAGEFQRAVDLAPKDGQAWHNLGEALRHLGRLDKAVEPLQRACALRKDVMTANALSDVLYQLGRFEEAKNAGRDAVEIDPQNAEAHQRLASALSRRGNLAEAADSFRRACDLSPHWSYAYGLGKVLADGGRLDEAEEAYREAIRRRPDYPEAHCNLGQTLRRKGLFAEALVKLRRGHELGTQTQGWRHPSDRWVRECERLVELDAKLAQVLKGDEKPADVAERLALADFCGRHKSLHAAAARHYADAFAEQPQVADDLQTDPRYDAARVAALAGCGQGKDADQLDARERARLRRQALDWLRADLAAYRRLLDEQPKRAGPAVSERLRQWKQDEDFAGVRGSDALAKLPDTAERQEWQQLWREVEELGQRAAAPLKPEKPDGPGSF